MVGLLRVMCGCADPSHRSDPEPDDDALEAWTTEWSLP